MTAYPKIQPRRPKKPIGEFSPATVELIWARDKGCCAFCGSPQYKAERGDTWSVHHRRPRGQGGTSLAWVGGAANGVTVCGTGTTGCHGLIESHRKDSEDTGFLVPINSGVLAAHKPIRHALYGWVLLNDFGGYDPQEVTF